ncbi:MAG: DUF3368 domain-containing protein [Cyclobacteriaceae bacterium]|nr:DUF3368 domain-containing protein [Cyclobacteriaceae bacterium]
MPDLAIPDTSCLVVLEKINELSLLQKIYREVIVSPEIVEEFGGGLPDWILVRKSENLTLQKELEIKLDPGEASALTLALDIPGSVVILDDLKARKIAKSLKVSFTGTLGVLVKAKREKTIGSIRPIVRKLRDAGLRFSEEVEKDILKQAGE